LGPAQYIDEAGFTNVVTVAYWDDRVKFDGWFPAARDGWTGDQRTVDGFGTFIEVLYPSVEGYETLFSSLGGPKVSVLADSMSGEVQEHAYWAACAIAFRFPRPARWHHQVLSQPFVMARAFGSSRTTMCA